MNSRLGAPRPRGRRPGPTATKEAILGAARSSFLATGYEETSLRSIAAAADVDVALLGYYFGSKRDLFAAAMALPVNPPDALGALFEDGVPSGRDVVARLLEVWDDPVSGPPLAALLKSATRDEQGRELVSGFIEAEIVGTVARSLPGPEARRRARAIATIILGFLSARYVLKLGFASGRPGRALADDFGALLDPWLKRVY